MGISLLKMVAAPSLAVLVGVSAVASAAEQNDRPEATAAAKRAIHVAPFVEDEEASKATERKPAKPAPRKSNFQPRFKTPAVVQAQHTEPVKSEAEDKATDAKTEDEKSVENTAPGELQPIVQPPRSGDTKGKPTIDEAFAKSKTAQADSDYTAIIELCRRAIDEGLRKNYEDYARRLMGWAYNRRGEVRAEGENDKEALADFEAAVELNKTSWRAIHNRGVSYAAHGRIKEALADFDRTIELNKEYTNAYFNRGELRYEQGDFEGAIRDYTAALRMGKPDSAIYNSRGHAFYRLQRFGDALRDYGEAVKIDPENAAALINRGDAYADVGRYGDAAKDYRAAVRVSPKLGRAFQSVAWLMATCPDEHYRNEKLAIDAAVRALELNGDDDYRGLETLAAAQANAGQFDKARETQEKAISKAPRQDLIACEKRMAMYQRDLAFRERPRDTSVLPEEQTDHQVRQASGTSRNLPQSRRPQQRTARPNKLPRSAPNPQEHPLGRN